MSFDNVFIKPKRSALPSRNVSLERELKFKHSGNIWTGIPIIAANMDHTGTFEMSKAMDSMGCMTALHKFHNVVDLINFANENTLYNTWASIGLIGQINLKDFADYVGTMKKYTTGFWAPNICIDVANGYTQKFSDFVATVRDEFPKANIMAGNVASGEMTEQLIISGADVVKVGIGPGSVCTTRKMTGVGVPQLSAIDECADAAHGLGGMICADGGCENPGHIAKAFAAGADFVMLGGMLAGHDQCDGELVFPDGSCMTKEKFAEMRGTTTVNMEAWLASLQEVQGMKFHGMSSKEAQEQHYGELKSYRAAEGKEVIVPYRGDVKDTVAEILGGLRSTMTYIGAQRLKDIPKCATLVRTNEQLNQSFS